MAQRKYYYNKGKLTKDFVDEPGGNKNSYAYSYNHSQNQAGSVHKAEEGKQKRQTSAANSSRLTEQLSVKKHNSLVWAIVFAVFSAATLISGGYMDALTYDIIASVLIFGGISLLFWAKRKRYKYLLKQAQAGAAPVPKMSASNNVSTLEKEAKQYLQYIKSANDQIPSEKLSTDISEIEKLTAEIFDYAIKNKNDTQTLKRFFSYYLPTTLKLLNSYVELEKIPLQTEQIIQTKAEIAEMLAKIKTAFAKLYDDIMQTKAMDISTEISAMENIMSSEGLINPIELDMKEYKKVYEKTHE